jgi:hypothetical protein
MPAPNMWALYKIKMTAVTTIYDFGSHTRPGRKTRFLELANMLVVGIKSQHTHQHISQRRVGSVPSLSANIYQQRSEILHGPVCSLGEMARKKSKRKSITLVRRID